MANKAIRSIINMLLSMDDVRVPYFITVGVKTAYPMFEALHFVKNTDGNISKYFILDRLKVKQ